MLVTQSQRPNSFNDTVTNHFNLGGCTYINSSSISSSPVSTETSSYHTFGDIDAFSVPRASKAAQSDNQLFDLDATDHNANFDDISLLLEAFKANIDVDTDQAALMSSAEAPWLLGSFPRPAGNRLSSHQRDSSLSSLGSTTGPDSPYTHNTSNPRIAVTDSDSFGDIHGQEGSCYQLSKPMDQVPEGFYQPYHQSLGQHGQSEMEAAYRPLSTNLRPRHERGLLPAPDFSIGQRSHTSSVASSVVSDSPATPSIGEPDVDDRRRRQVFLNSVPKLDRTMTDIYNDELYSPNLSITSASASPVTRTDSSLTNELFAQRLQAANQFLNVAHSQPHGGATREQSPFRQGSPLAPSAGHDFAIPNAPASQRVGFPSARQMRERSKLEHDSVMFQQQAMVAQQPSGPTHTMSPKAAMVDFKQEPGHDFPLFPPTTTGSDFHHISPISGHGAGAASFHPGGGYHHHHHPHQYMSNQIPTAISVPQQYPFIAEPRSRTNVDATTTTTASASTTRHPATAAADQVRRPSSSMTVPQLSPSKQVEPVGEGGGTYSCTYHGCTKRFDTPVLLQKHKREGHRQPHGLGGTGRRPVEAGPQAGLLNSQAGPHRCDRINPSTGKPCNAIFSRPYDLTRHEDTIHNARKQKVRCDICTEEKTFSRADALTRHYRVCHPELPGPGKHRRRTGL